MFKIGEFSRLTQVSIRMLRYYDEAGLLPPAQTDEQTGYRLYNAEQIFVLNRILFLRDLGCSVSEIGEALNGWEKDGPKYLLEKKQHEIENEIKREQDILAKIELAKRDIGKQKLAVHCNVSIKEVPGCHVLSLRRIVPDYYAEGQLWKELSAAAAGHQIRVSENTFTIYHDPEFKETDVDIEICAPVLLHASHEEADIITSIGEAGGFAFRDVEPVPLMASTMVHGSFHNIAGAYLDFAGWLQEHSQYIMGDTSRQIVHRGPWNEEDEAKYLTELQIPLLQKKNFSS